LIVICLLSLASAVLLVSVPAVNRPTPQPAPAVFLQDEISLHGVYPLKLAIYYPVSIDGRPDRSAAPYPLIVFCHGYGSSYNAYSWVPRILVPRGYVTAMFTMPKPGGGVSGPGGGFVDFQLWREAMTITIDYVLDKNTREGSALNHMVDPSEIGVSGHSMGGATTFMVTAYDARVKAGVSFSPPYHGFVWRSDVIEAARNVRVPMQVMVGSNDTATPPDSAEILYEALPGEKQLLVIRGASHSTFGDHPGPEHDLGERYMAAWFDYHLKGSPEAYSKLYVESMKDFERGVLTDLRMSG